MRTLFGQINIFMRMVGNMKAFKIRTFTLITFFALLMSIQFVSSMGLSQPTVGLRLLRGGSADFAFSISAASDTNDIECTYSISGMDPLIINFEEDTTLTIKEGANKQIYGSVSVPENTEIKRYIGKLVVGCKPILREGEITGSVINRVMNAEFSVNIVETEEEKKVPTLPPREMPAVTYNFPIIILIIIIIILAIGGYYWSERKKEE